MRFKLTILILLIIFATLFSGCNLFVCKQVPLSDTQAEEALNIALTQVGKPYEWGGRGPHTFDPSGLIVWSYKQVYPDLQFKYKPWLYEDVSMDVLWRYNVLPVLWENIMPGDLVFISSDGKVVTTGGLFVGWADEDMDTFEFVGSSSFYGEVCILSWPVEGTKREQWVIGAGRLMTSY